MRAWIPGMRDSAIEGLSTLARRPDWRCADDGEIIRARVLDALNDENPVVRMNAAEAFNALYIDLDAADRAQKAGDRLMGEQDATVQTVLLKAVASEMDAAPQSVDDVLKNFITGSATSTGAEDDGDEQRGLVVDVLTILAVTKGTPFAASSINQWFASAPQFGTESLRAIQRLRNYIAPQAEPELQARAFELLATAADEALVVLTRRASEQYNRADSSAAETAETEDALRIMDGIADQIYFASGAFQKDHGGQGKLGPSHESFALRAVPVLSTCAHSGVAMVLHQVVETLIYLGPLNEKRALVAIAGAVGDNMSYAGESLAGNLVIPYLKRLLAEHRELVLFDDEGVAAFRHLLSAFATAGNESALEMAFTFADVFR
jgi:hypothetical protein